MDSRRLKILDVTPGAVALMLARGSLRIAANPLPDDARVVRAEYTGARSEGGTDLFRLTIASESYPEVPEGCPIPQAASPRIQRPD